MPEYPRQEWAVPIAQHVADAIRLLRVQGRDIDAHLMLSDISRVFRSIMAVGNVPGGRPGGEPASGHGKPRGSCLPRRARVPSHRRWLHAADRVALASKIALSGDWEKIAIRRHCSSSVVAPG
jgi:hypothetical protein